MRILQRENKRASKRRPAGREKDVQVHMFGMRLYFCRRTRRTVPKVQRTIPSFIRSDKNKHARSAVNKKETNQGKAKECGKTKACGQKESWKVGICLSVPANSYTKRKTLHAVSLILML